MPRDGKVARRRGESSGAPSAEEIAEVYRRLLAALGPQHWWPAPTPLEVAVGAILTQNTAWRNVERAMDRLRDAAALDWARLRDLSEDELAELVRPAGTYHVKAARLKALVAALWKDHDGSLERMLAGPLPEARGRLLAVRGIGPETADAILLYAGGRPTFVIDAYTRRILRRHLLIGGSESYAEVQALFRESLPSDPVVYNEYHALLVELAKRHCRSRADCAGCPLADLPHDESL